MRAEPSLYFAWLLIFASANLSGHFASRVRLPPGSPLAASATHALPARSVAFCRASGDRCLRRLESNALRASSVAFTAGSLPSAAAGEKADQKHRPRRGSSPCSSAAAAAYKMYLSIWCLRSPIRMPKKTAGPGGTPPGSSRAAPALLVVK
eukprot:scaffold10793_cov140-Isochrysis_galbana.AAC.1